MAKSVPASLYQTEYSLENALHLWETSGEDGSINYYVDSDALEDDYSVPMTDRAVDEIHSILASIEDSVGIDFTESSWDNADWVIDATDDYDSSGVSLEDWGLWMHS